jgi:hypothetical protein
MASRLNRAWIARAAVAVAVSAVPLFAAGAAQASIAGGNASTSSNLPDIRSATILDATDVQVCFDKAVSQSSNVFTYANDIYLVGYNSASNYLAPIGATLDQKNADCVDLAFNSHSGSLDLGQFTAVTALANAVQTSSSGGQTNYADSTTLLSSTTHNGTRGLSSAPDLVGPAPVPTGTSTPNDIAYVFDQNIDPTSVSQTGFWYENANGQFCYSVGAAVEGSGSSGSTVVAQFPTASPVTGCDDTLAGDGTASVANARRAGVSAGAVRDVSDDPIYNKTQGTNMPTAANGGATNLASLVSATLGPESGQVTYTFDHPLNGADNHVGDFFVTMSNGDVVTGADFGGGTVTGGSNADSVVVTFPDLQYFNEYAVQAGVENDAAEATSGSMGSDDGGPQGTYTTSPGAVPIGGNAGAFARGFTTGPDMYAVSFDTTHDTAAASFDQRMDGVEDTDDDYADIVFLDANGNSLGSPTTVVIPSFPNPGPVTVTMDVDPAIMAEHPTQIAELPSGEFCGFYTQLEDNINDDSCSIPQIVSQTGTAARVKGIHVSKLAVKARRAHKGHPVRRSHRVRRAHRTRRTA